MNELQAILAAYHHHAIPWALATVIKTVGSTFRKAGARMLIGADGRRIGALSGGCLERDVVLQAQKAMALGVVRLAEYDASEDSENGYGMGCRGIVQILIEPLAPTQHPGLLFITSVLAERKKGVIVTVLAQGRFAGQLLWQDTAHWSYPLADPMLLKQIQMDAPQVLAEGYTCSRTYGANYEACFEVLSVPQALVICGAGADGEALVTIAKFVGWHVTVVDTHSAPRPPLRTVDVWQYCPHDTLVEHLKIPTAAAVVLMTHNFYHDQKLLQFLLPKKLPYIGVLGPRQRTQALLAGLPPTDTLYAPIGLDIGAETPAEIALAIVAEIQTVRNGRSGGYLRERPGPIHLPPSHG
jgi:xanthine dehydrogenase accessory factor